MASFFSYVDKKGDSELWDYDGAKFVEVTPGVSVSQQQSGLDPQFLDAYDGKVFFSAESLDKATKSYQ